MWENLPALKAELELFEQNLLGQFQSHKSVNSYLDKLSVELISSGGKRLRPAMTIASSMMGEYQREKVISTAMSIELLHTATLVHDDIIDNSQLRRNMPTVYAREGVNTAVFAGDYLYVKSILALASADLPVEYMQQLAKSIEEVCVGEVEQFRGRGTVPGFKTYLSRISRKTAALFAAACAAGAHLGGLKDDQVKLAARFGGYFGIAFQIKDDLLDIMESADTTGKPAGNDLKEGVITLPVILAATVDSSVRTKLESVLSMPGGKKASKRDLLQLVKLIRDTEGIEKTQSVLTKYIAKAGRILDRLPESRGRDMLGELLNMSFHGYALDE